MSIESVREVICELGGLERAAALAGVGYKAASAWQNHLNRLPPDTYVLFQGELQRKGHSANPSLWGMKLPRKRGRVRN